MNYESVLKDYLLAKEQQKNAEAKVKKLQAIILSDPTFKEYTLGTAKVKKINKTSGYKLKEYTPEQMQMINEKYQHCYELSPKLLAKEDESLVTPIQSEFLQVFAVKPDALEDEF